MSTYYSILSAVQTSVQQYVANTVIRRKLFRLESDILPIVYVVPEIPPGERIVGETFGRNVMYEYPVMVVYAAAGAADLTTGLQTFLTVRENIRTALYQTLLPNVSVVWDTTFVPDAVTQFAELIGTDYDVCGWRMLYKSKEIRAS